MSLNITNDVFSEVYSFLQVMGDSYKKKIPENIYDIIEKNRSIEYNPSYNLNEPFENQMKKETLAIIAYIDMNYWCETNEKRKIQKALYEKELNEELLKKQLYNPDNLFKTKNKNIENHSIIEYKKENLLMRFVGIIKNWFIKKERKEKNDE